MLADALSPGPGCRRADQVSQPACEPCLGSINAEASLIKREQHDQQKDMQRLLVQIARQLHKVVNGIKINAQQIAVLRGCFVDMEEILTRVGEQCTQKAGKGGR